MDGKKDKTLTEQRRSKRRKVVEEKPKTTPKRIEKKGRKRKLPEARVRQALADRPIIIKQEPFDPETEKILNFVASGDPYVPPKNVVHSLEGDSLEGDSLEGDSLEGDSLDGDSLEGDSLEGDSLEGDSLEDQSLEGQSLEGHSLEDHSLKDHSLKDHSLEAHSLEAHSLEAQVDSPVTPRNESLKDPERANKTLNSSSSTDVSEGANKTLNSSSSTDAENILLIDLTSPESDGANKTLNSSSSTDVSEGANKTLNSSSSTDAETFLLIDLTSPESEGAELQIVEVSDEGNVVTTPALSPVPGGSQEEEMDAGECGELMIDEGSVEDYIVISPPTSPVSESCEQEIDAVESDDLLSDEGSVEDEVVTSPAMSPVPSGSSEEEMEEDAADKDDFFKHKGACVFRIAGEEKVLMKSNIVPPALKIGFIGCGPMAEAFITYLLKTNHIVYGYNRTAGKWNDVPVKPIIVSTPAALVTLCEVVFCCVRDKDAVENIMEMPEGVLSAMNELPCKAYVEMSAVDPDTITKYSEEVTAKGGSYLNAQILRTRPAAYLGASIIKASGDRETFEKYRSCFAAFSSCAIFLSPNVVEASIASIIQHCIESLAIITLSDTMLAADKMGIPKACVSNGLEFSLGKRMEIVNCAALIMIDDRPDVFIPLRHVQKILRLAYCLKQYHLSGSALILTASNIVDQVLKHYPEAEEHDVSCLYKLRTDPYVRPFETS